MLKNVTRYEGTVGPGTKNVTLTAPVNLNKTHLRLTYRFGSPYHVGYAHQASYVKFIDENTVEIFGDRTNGQYSFEVVEYL